MSRRTPIFGAVALFLLAFNVLAGETALLVRPDEIRAEPFIDTPSRGRLAKDTKVEILKRQGGWLYVSSAGGEGWLRMLSVRREGAERRPVGGEIAYLASLPSGRTGVGSIVIATGVRGLDRPDAHALILTAGRFDDSRIPPLKGVQEDGETAWAMAQLMGVPENHIQAVVDGALTREGIGKALEELTARVRPNDRVFVYFSGYGSRQPDPNRPGSCIASLVSADGKLYSGDEWNRALQRVSAKSDKLMVLVDAGFADAPSPNGSPLAAKYWPGDAACPQGTRPLLPEPVVAGNGPGALNQALIAAARENEAALDQPGEGGLATQAWSNCLSGDAKDLDRSGAISVEELRLCAQSQIDRRLANLSISANHITVAGNARYVPSPTLQGSEGDDSAPLSAPARLDPYSTLQDIYYQRDDKRTVSLKTAKPAFIIGKDALELTLESSHAGYVYLIMVGSDGTSFDMLFPNQLDRKNTIQAHEKLRLPRAGWEMVPQGPAGRDHILAIVSDAPRDFSTLGLQAMGPFSSLAVSGIAAKDIQLVSASSSNAASQECLVKTTTRNLAIEKKCSNAFGAALVSVEERN